MRKGAVIKDFGLVEARSYREGEEALAVGRMDVAAGEALHGCRCIVELHPDARSCQRLDDFNDVLVEVDVPDGIVGQQHIAHNCVEAVGVGVVEGLVGADVGKVQLVD